ncbi:proline-rich protein 2-like [Camarhynchus parvulus]|uniref:proline-rich protein 2-like n=1 Tax=Geospiza parvula TaxID=87175 RepID=UPI001237A613|nr:proline-rich protein 2-like [Camarhynchus parvulus]
MPSTGAQIRPQRPQSVPEPQFCARKGRPGGAGAAVSGTRTQHRRPLLTGEPAPLRHTTRCSADPIIPLPHPGAAKQREPGSPGGAVPVPPKGAARRPATARRLPPRAAGGRCPAEEPEPSERGSAPAPPRQPARPPEGAEAPPPAPGPQRRPAGTAPRAGSGLHRTHGIRQPPGCTERRAAPAPQAALNPRAAPAPQAALNPRAAPRSHTTPNPRGCTEPPRSPALLTWSLPRFRPARSAVLQFISFTLTLIVKN